MSSNDCKVMREICQKLAKAVTVFKEYRAQTKKLKELPKPEEIEMEVFWRRPIVRFTEPEEKWSVLRRVRVPSEPIDIIYPQREQDW
ncbi:hypothetical protein GCK72_025031 [Caenorhabditis remanei]|uniref:Uncharacterized protein n=1 Tax=Caenorhabditis remanei TaxID=31234 RepID=A0A6A5G1R1_CAERE|nr:hypothetical protein GCK72_025031 [Caenorhabditis remanei]KAF1748564.1 hypothetical protein GCK72_025031 [Caenorhabditis remanei]